MGSHNLHIEKGRHSRTPRENRTCICNEEVQTLSHVIFKCPPTKRLPGICQLDEFFKLDYSEVNG